MVFFFDPLPPTPCLLGAREEASWIICCLLSLLPLGRFSNPLWPRQGDAFLFSTHKTRQANLGNNPFLKRDRPDSQHSTFSSKTLDQHFHGCTEWLFYLKAFAFAGKRRLLQLLFCLWIVQVTDFPVSGKHRALGMVGDASVPQAAWAGELDPLSDLSPWAAQPPRSLSAPQQYHLPALLVTIHDKLLTFGKVLNFCAERCSGNAKVTSVVFFLY